jgi:hypothetical protein
MTGKDLTHILSYDEYRAIRASMTVAEWELVQAKAKWEQMTPWAVLIEWPSLRGAGGSGGHTQTSR